MSIVFMICRLKHPLNTKILQGSAKHLSFGRSQAPVSLTYSRHPQFAFQIFDFVLLPHIRKTSLKNFSKL